MLLQRALPALLAVASCATARAEPAPLAAAAGGEAAFHLMTAGRFDALCRGEVEEGGAILPAPPAPAVAPFEDARAPSPGSLSSSDPAGMGTRTRKLAGLFAVGTVAVGYAAWWKGPGFGGFETTDEGWFGENTYAGGADKASHFFLGYAVGRLYEWGYRRIGQPEGTARWLSVASAAASGLIVELGDGFTQFGFSWQDALITAAGGAAGAAIETAGLQDTLGFRFGWLPKQVPPDPSAATSVRDHYSSEIYAADVRFAGLFPRADVDPGLARYLMVSATYSTRGYGWVQDDYRQRQLGLELGLDLPEILRGLGLRDDRWWKRAILTSLKYLRLPFTAVGFRYDLNSGTWMGPDCGDGWTH